MRCLARLSAALRPSRLPVVVAYRSQHQHAIQIHAACTGQILNRLQRSRILHRRGRKFALAAAEVRHPLRRPTRPSACRANRSTTKSRRPSSQTAARCDAAPSKWLRISFSLSESSSCNRARQARTPTPPVLDSAHTPVPRAAPQAPRTDASCAAADIRSSNPAESRAHRSRSQDLHPPPTAPTPPNPARPGPGNRPRCRRSASMHG